MTGIVVLNMTRAIPAETLEKINQAIGLRLATKFGTRGAVNLGKVVPVLGGITGGGFDAAACALCGRAAMKTFLTDGGARKPARGKLAALKRKTCTDPSCLEGLCPSVALHSVPCHGHEKTSPDGRMVRGGPIPGGAGGPLPRAQACPDGPGTMGRGGGSLRKKHKGPPRGGPLTGGGRKRRFMDGMGNPACGTARRIRPSAR